MSKMDPWEFGRALVESREEWRDVPDYPEYKVSNYGRVITSHTRSRAAKNGGFLKLCPDKDGYLKVGLWNTPKKKQEWWRVHHLVLIAFVGSRPDGMEGCHKDGKCTNNHLTNLRWDTPKNNHRDAVESGTHAGFTKKGENNPFNKLTEAAVRDIRQNGRLGRAFAPQRRNLAHKHGVSYETIGDILRRRSWKHLN